MFTFTLPVEDLTHHRGKIHIDDAPILDADWLQPSNGELSSRAAVQEPKEPVSPGDSESKHLNHEP